MISSTKEHSFGGALLYATVSFMRDLIAEMMDKWQDVINTSDDRTERTLAEEMVEDLHELDRALHGEH